MINLAKKAFSLLDKKESINFILVIILILFMGIFDAIGIASVGPLVSIAVNPNSIIENNNLSLLYTFFEGANYIKGSPIESFIIKCAIVVFILLSFSLILKAITIYIYERFVALINFNLSTKLTSKYLDLDYVDFLGRHSSDIGKSILSEVNNVVVGALLPFMRAASAFAVTISMFILIFLTDPLIAASGFFIFLVFYSLIYSLLRKFISTIGEDRYLANAERFKIIQEAFQGIKEIKLYNLEYLTVEKYKNPAKRFALHTASQHIYGQLPRILLEFLVFGGIVLSIIYIFVSNNAFESILPMFSVIALASYRLIPNIQQLFTQFTQIKFTQKPIENLYEELSGYKLNKSFQSINSHKNPPSFKASINLNKIKFSYPFTDSMVLDNINFDIQKGQKVGIVGDTGAGKSTLIDILIGLLEPTGGSINLDNNPKNYNKSFNLRSLVGYVPQSIYLTDGSIKQNIAFGINEEDIDIAWAERCADIAEVKDFICSLDNRFDQEVGERGVRISGGERQRIAIARALYKRPQILVLDEATSALDNITESKIVKNILSYDSDMTIIMIAHRISSIRECDTILLLNKGKITASGDYQNLMNTSNEFKKLVFPDDTSSI